MSWLVQLSFTVKVRVLVDRAAGSSLSGLGGIPKSDNPLMIGVHTVTVAVLLSILPHELVIRTQYFVDELRAGVTRLGELVPTGFDVSPLLPSYHWNVSGELPSTPTTNAAV
jgi:hypothetical protein